MSKFLGKLEATLTDQETREGWWEQLRDEIRSHARSMCCTHIIGYSESCSLYGDVCVLSAEGTGAKVKHLPFPALSGPGGGWRGGYDSDASREDDKENERSQMSGSRDKVVRRRTRTGMQIRTRKSTPLDIRRPYKLEMWMKMMKRAMLMMRAGGNRPEQPSRVAYIKGQGKKPPRTCNLVHVPYKRNRAPFGFMRLVPCLQCKRKWVPELMLSTSGAHSRTGDQRWRGSYFAGSEDL